MWLSKQKSVLTSLCCLCYFSFKLTFLTLHFATHLASNLNLILVFISLFYHTWSRGLISFYCIIIIIFDITAWEEKKIPSAFLQGGANCLWQFANKNGKNGWGMNCIFSVNNTYDLQYTRDIPTSVLLNFWFLENCSCTQKTQWQDYLGVLRARVVSSS